MKRPLHGFTLVELLVVISIIGVLVGLLMPAVNMAREAARRSWCSNNLKQLAAGCLSHSQQYGFFPSGGWGSSWVGIPDAGTGPNQPGGWIYQLLPFLDQVNLHDSGKGLNNPALSSARVSTPLPLLYCTTRRASLAYPISGTGASPQLTNAVTQAGRTDYAINGGTVPIANGSGPSGLSAGLDPSASWPDLTNFDGIAAAHSQISEAMITDSKITTYLMAEKYMSPENYIMGVDTTGYDPGDLCSAMSADDVSLIRWGNTSLLPSQDRTSSNNPPQAPGQPPSQIFGSSHHAGWHAAFCDGHVQLIGWNIDPTLHRNMSSRNGIHLYSPNNGWTPVNPASIPH